MTVKSDFKNAFTSLVDAMAAAPSPKPRGTKGRWTQASIRAAANGRDDAAWRALPTKPVGAVGATRELVNGREAVDGADYESAGSVRSALDLVEAALGSTEDVLSASVG